MRCFSLACSLFLTLSYAQKIRTIPDDTRTVTLNGNRHPLARVENEVGTAAAGHRMDRMILVLSAGAEQDSALDSLIAAQQDPSSASYQQWLTPELFAERFGVSQNDVDQVTAWLGTHGFTIDEVPAGRRTIVFSGTAEMVETAFHTAIKMYRVKGELHYANARDPQIPEALAAVVKGTVTLHDFPRRSLRTASLSVPDFSSGGSYYLAPADFAAIYNLNPLYSVGIDGTGTSIAIVGRTNINMSDVQTFRSYFGLPVNNPQIILNGANPGITSDVDEAALDVEWSGAVARGATIKFVVSASTSSTDGVDLSAQYIVSKNLATAMSTSYGSCEATMGTAELAFYKNLWQQAAAQGISTMISAGDSGGAGCDGGSATTASDGKAVNGLCSSIYSVCVGGTEFVDASNYGAYWTTGMNAITKESAISYIPEAAWNQSGSLSGGSGLWAGGGGASAIYSKPSWQAGPGVPADGKRDVPDVSLAASTHDGFLVVEGGYLYVIGGTSASAPSFAGIMALVNQKNGAQGNPNPILYALATMESNRATAHSYFHDITSGSNTVPGQTGFSAGTGYDLATGLGTINASDLVNFWHDAAVSVPPSMSVGMSAGALTVRQGASGTSTATIAVAGGFSSAVTIAVSGAAAGVTATMAAAGMPTPGSGSSVLTIVVASTAVPGTSMITVTAAGGGITSTASVNLTIVAPFSVAASVPALSVQQGAAAGVTLTTSIATGFSGVVALATLGTLPAGITAVFTPSTIAAPGAGTSSLTISASKTATPGAYSIAVKGTSGSYSNTAVFFLTVSVPAGFAMSAAPTTITAAQGASATTTLTLTPSSGLNTQIGVTMTGAPAGVTLQSAGSSTNRNNLTVTAKVASTVAPGNYPITIVGTATGVAPQTVVVTLVVSGFTVATTSSTAVLARAASVLAPITTAVTGGFAGALSLTVTGLPAGVTAVFTPASIANPAAGSSSLKLTALQTAAEGTKALTVIATSANGATQSIAISLTVH